MNNIPVKKSISSQRRASYNFGESILLNNKRVGFSFNNYFQKRKVGQEIVNDNKYTQRSVKGNVIVESSRTIINPKSSSRTIESFHTQVINNYKSPERNYEFMPTRTFLRNYADKMKIKEKNTKILNSLIRISEEFL